MNKCKVQKMLHGGIMKHGFTLPVLFLVLAAALNCIAPETSQAEYADRELSNYVAIKGGIYSPSDHYDIDMTSTISTSVRTGSTTKPGLTAS